LNLTALFIKRPVHDRAGDGRQSAIRLAGYRHSVSDLPTIRLPDAPSGAADLPGASARAWRLSWRVCSSGSFRRLRASTDDLGERPRPTKHYPAIALDRNIETRRRRTYRRPSRRPRGGYRSNAQSSDASKVNPPIRRSCSWAELGHDFADEVAEYADSLIGPVSRKSKASRRSTCLGRPVCWCAYNWILTNWRPGHRHR